MTNARLTRSVASLAGLICLASLICLGGLLSLTSLAQAQAPESQPSSEAIQEPEVADPAYHALEVAKGQALVEKHCARCHAIGTSDKSTHEQAPPFRDVVTRYPAEHLAEALAEGIQSGHPDMPVFVFEPEDINAFLAYLDSLAPQAER